jgi:hypothetical protein
MFSLKSRAVRAGVAAALLWSGGSAAAQDRSVLPTDPWPLCTPPAGWAAAPPAPAATNTGVLIPTIPGPVIPGGTAPGATGPGTVAPGAVPGGVAPGTVLPDVPVPGGAAPGTVAPGAPGAAPPAQPGCGACDGGFDWTKVPRTRPTPRAGFFPVPPAGPGYYSLFDRLQGNYLEAPPKYPYPRTGAIFPGFFDVDNFSYLDNPNNTEHDFFDPLKRIRLGPNGNWLFTTGGEFRTRYEDAVNDRMGKTTNVYQLTRTRVYGDLWYRDDFRLFVEYIGAWSAFQDLPPLPIDQQKFGIQNLFVDLKLADWGGDPAYVRIGRQELLFGSQRLISTLDWANTRRTFQGVRGFRQTENWDFDMFWVQPVIPANNRPSSVEDGNEFNSVDYHQNFVGAWATNRPKPGQVIDLYYLMLDNTNSFSQMGIPRGNFTRHTMGGRYAGNQGNFLFDSETAFQFGSQNDRDVFAAMTTQGIGYNFKDAFWTPTVWAYYDYASGGNPINGTAHTFNQLFPFGHYYFGWIDQVGRQNIHDLNFHLYMYPAKWLTAWVQFHSFWLANGKDALYNAGGNVLRFDPTGKSGTHVGEELDFVYNIHLSKHADILTGYCYLWGGEFMKKTVGKTGGVNSGLTFLQFSYKW